jgi:hypothetical protein
MPLVKEKKQVWLILCLLIYFLIAFFNLRGLIFTPGIIGFHCDWDLPPFGGQYKQAFRLYWYPWIGTRDFGILSPAPVSFTGSPNSFLSIFMYFLASIGLEGEAITKIICIVALTIMGFTMYLLCKKMGISNLSSFWAGLFYMNTPMVFDRFAMGHPYFIFDYALFPLAFYIIFSNLSNFKKSVLAGFVITLGSNNAATFFIFLYSLIIYYLLLFITTKRKSNLMQYVFSITIIYMVYFCLYAYWTVPAFIDFLKGSSKEIIKQEMTYLPVRWTVDTISFRDAIRILTSPNYFFADLVRSSKLWNTLGYLPAIISIIMLILKRRKKEVIFFSILVLSGIFLSTGGTKWIWLIEHFPALSIYRDASKWGLLTCIGYSFFIALFIDIIRHFFEKIIPNRNEF